MIPLDKSWVIRMGFLDVINDYKDIEVFLDTRADLNDDLMALRKASQEWATSGRIEVGESGTIYRFFRFAAWKLGLDKKFVREGTLQHRHITDDPSIITWPLAKLLSLDNGTSQWASAAVLMGNEERVDNPPYKLRITYDAVAHWKEKREKGEMWEARYDETIRHQAETFKKMVKGETVYFVPEQAEDYCFARMFGFINMEEGEKRWPALRGHESDRLTEMEVVIRQVENNEPVLSRDHRVVQAAGFYQRLHGHESTVMHPSCVSKSWPQFWEFLSQDFG